MVVMVVINVVALLMDGAEMAVVSLGHWARHVNVGLCRQLLDNFSRRLATDHVDVPLPAPRCLTQHLWDRWPAAVWSLNLDEEGLHEVGTAGRDIPR